MGNGEVIKHRVGVVGWLIGPDGGIILLPLHPESWEKNEAIGCLPYTPLTPKMWEGISGGVKDNEDLRVALTREADQERGLREGYRLGDFLRMPFKVMQNGSRTPTKFDVLVFPMLLQHAGISRLCETGSVITMSPDYLLRHPDAVPLRPLTEAVARHVRLYGV